MSNIHKFTIYNSGMPVLINLDKALAIAPSEYQQARCIISLGTNGAGEDLDYYVRETFEHVQGLIAQKGLAQ